MPLHYPNYYEWSAADLRSFIKLRSGKSCTSNDITYLGGKLRALDRNKTFRFMDLPKDLRFMVYDELFHRPDGTRQDPIYSQILRTSREVYLEVQPQLNRKVTLLTCIEINSRRFGSRFHCKMGSEIVELHDIENARAVMGTVLPLYEKIYPIVKDVQNISLEINLYPGRNRFALTQLDDVARLLFVMTAALRGGRLQKITVKLQSSFGVDWFLWPLSRIKAKVTMSMIGDIPDSTEKTFLPRRVLEDTRLDSIQLSKKLMARVDDLIALIVHLDEPDASLKVQVLRNKTIRATKWDAENMGDRRAMKALNSVKADLREPDIKALVQRARESVKGVDTDDSDE